MCTSSVSGARPVGFNNHVTTSHVGSSGQDLRRLGPYELVIRALLS